MGDESHIPDEMPPLEKYRRRVVEEAKEYFQPGGWQGMKYQALKDAVEKLMKEEARIESRKRTSR